MTFSKLGTDTQTHQPVYLPKASRLQGLYIIGIQGTGKSGLIENLIMQDIDQQIGVCVLDPHGELIDHVIARLEPKNEKDVILLDLANYAYPFGLNVFTCSNLTNPLEVQKTVDQVLHVFEKLLGVSQDTPLILEYLYNSTYTLIVNPGYTMADIPLLLQDEQCRKKLVAQVTDPDVSLFWMQHDKKKPSDQYNDIASTLRRVKQFLQPLSRPIVGQAQTTIDLQKIMQEGKILLVKLSATVDSVSSLIGSLMIALLLNASYNRPAQRRQFHLYADEFQRFATEDFATLLEEARKFGIGTTIAHQNRGQLNSANSKLETDLKDRSRSVGNMVVFKINSKDADDLAGEFDTTPPPPKQEEATRRAIQTPVSNPINWLLSGKTHTNPVVNTFISKWNMRKIEQLRHQDKYPGSLTPGIGNYRTEATQFLDIINTLCFQAMIYKNPDAFSFPVSFFRLLGYFWQEIFDRMPFDFDYINALISIIPDHLWQNMTLSALISLLSSSQWGTLIEREFHKKKLTNCLYRVCSAIKVGRAAEESTFNNPKLLPYIQQQLQEQLILSFQQEPYNNPHWVSIDVNRLQWFPTVEYVDKYANSSHPIYKSSTIFQLGGHAGIQQLKDWYTPYALEREIDRIMASPKGVIYAKQLLVSFLSDLLAMVQVLAVEPIEEDSGRQEIVYRPGTVRPYQDIKNDIANQLSGLPTFTARIKIGGNATQNPGKKCLSCGRQNNSGAKFCSGCGTQLPAPNEYTIATLKPAAGVSVQQLQQRIARIQARNLQVGYVRERVKVEAEILQRQSSCSGSSAPAQPQKQQQRPQQPSPQAQARHARNVPVQGNCQNCGAVNSSNAKFCNQCGTKL